MIYLDYAATNPFIYEPTIKDVDYNDVYFNPNANYAVTEKRILFSRENTIKKAIGAKNGHILYFRTCSDAVRWLSQQNWDAVRPASDTHDALYLTRKDADLTRNSDVLVMYSHTNHLNGNIMSDDEMKWHYQFWNANKCNVYFLLDCTQTLGKAEMPNLDYVDAVTMSGHKIGYPYLSWMWVSDRLCNKLHLHQSIENQWGVINGTLSVKSVTDLALATINATSHFADKENKYAVLKKLLKLYLDKIDNGETPFYKFIETHPSSDAINLIAFNQINADVLQQYLASNDCYVGIAASACAGNSMQKYRVAEALEMQREDAARAIRVSFGVNTTDEDIEQLVKLIAEYKTKFC